MIVTIMYRYDCDNKLFIAMDERGDGLSQLLQKLWMTKENVGIKSIYWLVQ